MADDDYTLTIEDVAKRLNKSVRTVHRYKNSRRLSFNIGETQGNPLFFSRKEVEGLARELYPNLATPATPPVDVQFWDRLERVEKLLSVLEHNPMLERVMTLAGGAAKEHQRHDIEDLMLRLATSDGGPKRIDNKELGRLLIRLGNLLLEE